LKWVELRDNAMNIKKKLSNPFALVAQGFALGAILFFANPASTGSTATAAVSTTQNV
jgi:hypothetical protein